MFIGVVKWFDNKKGFGTLAIPSGEEVFLHIREFVTAPLKEIRPKQVIVGYKRANLKRGGHIAGSCRILDHLDDGQTVFALLNGPDTVVLPDRQKVPQHHSLRKLAATQLFQGKDADSIFTMVTALIDGIAPDLFIPYSAFLEKALLHSIADKNAALELLSRIFHYFGSHLTYDLLFRVWKAGKFRYLGYELEGDYEIPEEVLNLNATEIGYNELQRISGYSYGPAFCSEFVNALLEGVDTMDRNEIETLVPYLDFLEKGDREYWKNIVNA